MLTELKSVNKDDLKFGLFGLGRGDEFFVSVIASDEEDDCELEFTAGGMDEKAARNLFELLTGSAACALWRNANGRIG